jgi:hypothetical protein
MTKPTKPVDVESPTIDEYEARRKVRLERLAELSKLANSLTESTPSSNAELYKRASSSAQLKPVRSKAPAPLERINSSGPGPSSLSNKFVDEWVEVAESRRQSVTAIEKKKLVTNAPTAARSDLLNPIIHLAKKNAQDGNNYQSVWAEMVKLADSKNRPAPLLGFIEGEGVKYQAESEVKFFTKRNLADRMRRAESRNASLGGAMRR